MFVVLLNVRVIVVNIINTPFVKVLCDLIINRPCNIVSETKKFTLKNKLFVIIFNCLFFFVMFNIVSGDQEFSQIICDL